MFKKSIFLAFIIGAFLTTTFASAAENTLFEGYSKIMNAGVHVGYIVTRYEFRDKEQKFYGTYLIKTGQLGSDITESLKAVADSQLNPISYEYTSIVGKTTKTIDAKFAKGKMTAVVKTTADKGKPHTVTIRKDIPKGTFLSTFLVYLMMKSKQGMQTSSKYEYKAIAEEDADIVKGEALVGEKQLKFNGFQAFKIFNRFKDARFVSHVTDQGDVLGTLSPATGIGTELVAKPSEATAQFPVSASVLRALFGDVPIGTHNAVSRKLQLDALPASPPPPNPKQHGVPQNQGIIIKAQKPDTVAPPTIPVPSQPVPPPPNPAPVEGN